MEIQTAHFGRVEIEAEEIIEFTAPLPPFSDWVRFVLLRDPQEAPFSWLQSVESPALAFIVAPYEEVTGALPPPLSEAQRRELGLWPQEKPEVYVILCVAERAEETTMNLLAPLFICARTKRGRQIVMEENPALARVPLFPSSTPPVQEEACGC